VPAEMLGVNKRQMVRTLGIAAVIAVPVSLNRSATPSCDCVCHWAERDSMHSVVWSLQGATAPKSLPLSIVICA